jgi:hypothetical protein
MACEVSGYYENSKTYCIALLYFCTEYCPMVLWLEDSAAAEAEGEGESR